MNTLKNELKLYIKNNLVNEETFRKRVFSKSKEMMSFEGEYSYVGSNIKDYIESHSDYSDFQTMLFKLIDERNLKDSDVYNKVHLDRRLFSKIRSDKNYHPSKETVLLLAIALELSEKELDELLDSASYSLPKNNEYDLIIRFCFINKIFKLSNINELLDEYHCKLFSY